MNINGDAIPTRALETVIPRTTRDRRTGGDKARNLLHKQIKADTRTVIIIASANQYNH